MLKTTPRGTPVLLVSILAFRRRDEEGAALRAMSDEDSDVPGLDEFIEELTKKKISTEERREEGLPVVRVERFRLGTLRNRKQTRKEMGAFLSGCACTCQWLGSRDLVRATDSPVRRKAAARVPKARARRLRRTGTHYSLTPCVF